MLLRKDFKKKKIVDKKNKNRKFLRKELIKSL